MDKKILVTIIIFIIMLSLLIIFHIITIGLLISISKDTKDNFIYGTSTVFSKKYMEPENNKFNLDYSNIGRFTQRLSKEPDGITGKDYLYRDYPIYLQEDKHPGRELLANN